MVTFDLLMTFSSLAIPYHNKSHRRQTLRPSLVACYYLICASAVFRIRRIRTDGALCFRLVVIEELFDLIRLLPDRGILRQVLRRIGLRLLFLLTGSFRR